jgi:GNAT superfamily N-acetyltransferase
LDTSEILICSSNEFIEIYKGLESLYFRYLECEEGENIKYFVLLENYNVVGILKEKIIQGYSYLDYNIENMRTIMYITISSKYQNRGYSKILLNNYFLYLRENNYNKLYLSPYSKMGYEYLRKILYKLAKDYCIEMVDKNYCYEY